MSTSISSLSGTSSTGGVDLSAMRQKMLEKMYAEMDADGDAAVSKDEFVAAAEARQAERGGSTGNSSMPSAAGIFDEADTDSDGSLTEDEFATYSAKMQPKGGMGRPPAMGGAKGANSVSSTEEDEEEESDSTSTDPADTDGDGEISLEEQMSYIKKQIEKYAQMMASQSTASSATYALA